MIQNKASFTLLSLVILFNIFLTMCVERFRDARSVFRLTKFIFEIKRIKIIYEVNDDKFSMVFNILSRLFYMFHWFFDNIYILMKLMDIKSAERDLAKSLSRKCWFIGVAIYLVYCTKVLRKTYTDESDLKVAAINNMTVRQVKEYLNIIIKLRRDY